MTATNTDDATGLDPDQTSTALLPVRTSTDVVPVRPAEPEGRPAGSGLIAEAELAIEQRRWRDAIRLLDAIESIGAGSVHTDGLLAVAATHLNRRKRAREAIGRVRAATPTASTHRALAEVAIARHDFLAADIELRRAIDLTTSEGGEASADDWAHLASVYGGLGWFDEANECLEHADAIGTTDEHRWIIGRSINHWGMSRTWAVAVAVILFIPLGLLSIAVGLTVPFLVREFRLTQVDERLAAVAADAWTDERWLRLAHASGVLATVVLWTLAIQL